MRAVLIPILIVGCVGLRPAVANAQGMDLYVLGGLLLAADGRQDNKGVTLGGGIRVAERLSLEVSFTWHSYASEIWTGASFLGFAPYYQVRTRQRDKPLLWLLRYHPVCHGRVCLEPAVGGGLSFREELHARIANCPVSPSSCTPTQVVSGPGTESGDYVLAGSVDFRIRASPHFELRPSVQVSYAFRPGCDTQGRACSIGPEPLTASRFQFGLSGVWRLK